MGTQILAADTAANSGSSGSSSSLLLIILVFAVLMIFMFRSQRRRKQQAQDTQSRVMNGTRIRTVHGIYGTVVDSDDRNVMVEIAPGVKIKMLRQAIGAVVPDDEPDGLHPTMQAFEEPETNPDMDPDTSDQSSAKPEDRSNLSA
jgi:preprotein translocase subunit YajC